ncbi:AMMECR1 domain protein [Thermogladius calderae 1633]|uniref:Protein TCELL_0012 n=1 Tax=Thermogladius calderae (strain DSM 22663 / VKM B-2946 / 1633) TaxID=1184251 RepID=I3TCE9_THEC1|nr:TIGR00296 family protein [Thermogladius calderae]AFK50437.1 AMMECR1 domain protein [Thermogladius calderae 1633]
MSVVSPSELTFEEGVLLVKIAREAVENIVRFNKKIKPSTDIPGKFRRPGMTFTTLEIVDSQGRFSLRGCIGFLAPVYSLVDSLIESAVSAAVNDPRFHPVEPWELDSIVVEVSVLSPPVELKAGNRADLVKQVKIGRHGLIVEYGRFYQGTLLPEVPIEYCWDEETFLSETCLKAGLRPTCWLNPAVKVYAYEARVFRERAPRGEVVERSLEEEYSRNCLRERL